MSPYIGHREPNLSELGVSPIGTPGAPEDTVLIDRITRLVSGAAKDEDDRSMLLQALGIEPTVHEGAVAS